MCRKSILLVILSAGIIVHGSENNLQINPNQSLELQMMNLDSELKLNAVKSSYTRVIVWKTIPTSEDLKHYFNKFSLLRFKEEFTSEKFDIIEKNDFTYERFLYAYFPEQQLAVTVFVKVDFNSEKASFLVNNFIQTINAALKKFGLTDKDVSVDDQTHSNNSYLWKLIWTSLIIIIVLLLYFYSKRFCSYDSPYSPGNKNTGYVDNNENIDHRELQKLQNILAKQQKLSFDLVRTYNESGNVYHSISKYLEALLSYTNALKIQEISLLNNNRGNTGYKIDDYRQALLSYETASKNQRILCSGKYPDFNAAFDEIGKMYETMNNFKEAEFFFKCISVNKN